jgi:hypothetical protein
MGPIRMKRQVLHNETEANQERPLEKAANNVCLPPSTPPSIGKNGELGLFQRNEMQISVIFNCSKCTQLSKKTYRASGKPVLAYM